MFDDYLCADIIKNVLFNYLDHNFFIYENTIYHINSKLPDFMEVKQKDAHGKCHKFYCQTNIFVEDKLIVKYIYDYTRGGKTLRKVNCYNKNLQLEGKIFKFSLLGSLQSISYYKKGSLDGIQLEITRYSDDLLSYDISNYKKGCLDGITEHYDKRVLKHTINYKRKSKQEHIIIYDEGVKYEEYDSDGKGYHGDYIMYAIFGQIIKKLRYKKGKIVKDYLK